MPELTEQDRRDLNKSVAAERIMGDPLVLEALAAIDQGIFEAWKTPGVTAEQREELYRRQAAMQRFVSTFEQYLQNGAVARQIAGLPVPEKTFFQRIKERIHARKKD